MGSVRLRATYLIIVIIFLIFAGFLWLDYIGLMDLDDYRQKYLPSKPEQSIMAKDDEPALLKMEELRKQEERLNRDMEQLTVLRVQLEEKEKQIQLQEEKISEQKKGLLLERQRFEDEKQKYASYQKNIEDLAEKMGNMPPAGAIEIMQKWNDLLIIDVLRRMDELAEREGRQTITAYLIYLIQQQNPERAGNIMRKMAEFTPEDS